MNYAEQAPRRTLLQRLFRGGLGPCWRTCG